MKQPKKQILSTKRHFSLTEWAIANKICLYSFLIPFLIMLGIFIGRDIYPFGDESFMHSDMYHQYVPFLTEFVRKIRGGEGLSYSWNIGVGASFLSLYAYYAASPLNWLALSIPESLIIEFMSYMVVLKVGLCGFTFAYYLTRKFQVQNISVVLFTTFYALSGFIAAYNWNVMWMDCIVLAPLILLGLEKLVKEGKGTLYCITLTLSILTNYYLSIMLCIFLCLYFLVLLVTAKKLLQAILRFAFYSLLAGGMAAVLLIPVACALYYTEFAQTDFPDKLKFYFSFLDMLSRHCTNVTPETGLDHWPNIYCGCAVLFLIPLYIMNGKISWKEKMSRLLLAGFMLLSFSVNILTFIWHGLNYPNSLPSRQSYLYILLILTLCFEAFQKLEDISKGQLISAFAFGFGMLLIFQKLTDEKFFTDSAFLLTALFLIIYALLLYLYKESFAAPKMLTVIAILAIILESTINMAVTSVSTTSRSKYIEDLPAYDQLADRIEEERSDFFRIEKFSRTTKNDGALADYSTSSLFSSTANANVENWYDRMGLSESKVFYCFDGQTPFSSALLNVHYMFSTSAEEDNTLYELTDQIGNTYLYKNRYTLPTGFIVSDDWLLSSTELSEAYEDPLLLQNAMVQSMGISDLFTGIEVLHDGKTDTILVPEAGHYYAYSSKNIDTVKMESESIEKTFKKLKYDYICDLGWHEAGETITLTNKDDDKALHFSAYRLNTGALETALTAIGHQDFTVTDYDSTHMNGTVTVTEAGQLVISVAYEPGWTLKVDGEEVEIELFDECFISTYLAEGTHEISLTFFPKGLIAGIAVSILSLTAFVLLTRALNAKKEAADTKKPLEINRRQKIQKK